MSLLRQIQRGVDFIEAHLDTDIELVSVSKAAGVSHSHFQRMFKALTGETLKTYIRARRMAHALHLLLATDTRVLDVAIAAGFESQEAFARAFKKTFGMTPTAYRKVGSKALFLEKVRFDQDYLTHLSEGISMQPTFEQRSTMHCLGMRTRFFGAYSDKNNLGDKLHRLWDAFTPRAKHIPHCVGDGVYYGVVRQHVEHADELDYFACREVQLVDDVPPEMAHVEVPAARYAVFTHRGPTSRVNQTVDYIYGTWLMQSEYWHTYGPDLEIYGPRWHPTSPESEMGYAIPVRPRD